MSTQHHTVLIIGGGAAGVSVTNNMRRQNSSIDIALIEPSEIHYYQPGFTIIGGGAYTMAKTSRNEADLIHPSVTWIKDYAETFQPDANTVTLRSGTSLSYDYLVVCPGLQLDWQKIEGLKETLNHNGVCSNYSAETVEYTWECIRNLQSGTALFTQPVMPIKCAGAPQKIMYLASDRFRKKGILDKISVEFCNAGPAMFGIPFFAKALDKVVADYGIKTHFQHNLVAIDGPAKTAFFEKTDADGNKTRVSKQFDMIHVTPPQSAPDFIKNSPLANPAGWVDLHEKTLQHNRYSNIFGLGDAGSTPNAKTAAAIRKQVPVVVDNILNLISGKALSDKYDGYGSCPLTTSLSTVMLAEFSYSGKVTPSFPILDPRQNRFIWWWGKTTGFPWMYWHMMLKGYRIDIPHKDTYVKQFLDDN
ncbi:MAG: FAD/NAD(P)-binding oxidoreductase [Methylicorpusculum sp.]|uniref:NAD(P)/FAD-dependent oxidoreductase n=1 Tax=Methylicorpusculum sp. TaxID=2713644 RepID=UPI00271C9071|nr:FAD/NAD(P)-binding oxidoreductase [Methylicorpusculum sp.]MDO8937883.1 FAD/NAD(P)-binding oxidoreductase [Methylicorpusculum sp.]MDO9239841.1 FAD/NAD(P)-binding oxidoreductase [Methylicorpusculum sp.]MDP2200660.1 FAD/NAD(P)-binding oxidoreductase [Methylicorpusculum sp.]